LLFSSSKLFTLSYILFFLHAFFFHYSYDNDNNSLSLLVFFFLFFHQIRLTNCFYSFVDYKSSLGQRIGIKTKEEEI